MISGIIGRKVGMTQIFAEDGTVAPVTVIKAGPCVVIQTKSAAGRDGYNAVQLGLVEEKPVRLKNVSKPLQGHFEKTGGGTPPTRILKEIRLGAEPEAAVGGDSSDSAEPEKRLRLQEIENSHTAKTNGDQSGGGKS